MMLGTALQTSITCRTTPLPTYSTYPLDTSPPASLTYLQNHSSSHLFHLPSGYLSTRLPYLPAELLLPPCSTYPLYTSPPVSLTYLPSCLRACQPVGLYVYQLTPDTETGRVQELCESRGGRPELSVPTSFTVSVDVKLY